MIWHILMNSKILFFFYQLWHREVLTRSRVAISCDCKGSVFICPVFSQRIKDIHFIFYYQKLPLLRKSILCLSFSSSHQIHQRFKALFLSFLKDIWKATEAFRTSPSTYDKSKSKLQPENRLIATPVLCCHPKSMPENGQGWSNLVIHSLSGYDLQKSWWWKLVQRT